jgi:hypothetical protein
VARPAAQAGWGPLIPCLELTLLVKELFPGTAAPCLRNPNAFKVMASGQNLVNRDWKRSCEVVSLCDRQNFLRDLGYDGACFSGKVPFF